MPDDNQCLISLVNLHTFDCLMSKCSKWLRCVYNKQLDYCMMAAITTAYDEFDEFISCFFFLSGYSSRCSVLLATILLLFFSLKNIITGRCGIQYFIHIFQYTHCHLIETHSNQMLSHRFSHFAHHLMIVNINWHLHHHYWLQTHLIIVGIIRVAS